ncbi:PREDICTED: glycerophosphodiester phosphodiesterase domain-containing protein 1-like isoform X2 [Branchiostoma belcheri]|uniref:Glycerophosphodiester phosphodiesterase domain-containing protein 1-like isoform X2 n=1 Tax=Branchiostoma belcheri TaxID=7741 RepID=A0A6P4YC78_BRABE|nr:PREDICTED: glycerophosphodiester phosphodiesterase domain-containing protein 1-like isoform X2 [Branchiostoma belcheri]
MLLLEPNQTLWLAMGIVAAIVGGYALTSLFLLRFPNLLHRKKQLKFCCKHISHRGGMAEGLENTMGTFQHAVDLGTDMLELDVQLSQDGMVVVSHDNDIKRTTGVDVKISDTKFADLPLLRTNQEVSFLNGLPVCFPDASDRSFCLLQDVFEKFPGVVINVDIKNDDDELIAKVGDLIHEYKREAITVCGSRLDTVARKFHKQNPDIPLFFSAKRVVQLVLLFYSGLLPFIPLKESCLEVIMPSILWGERWADTVPTKYKVLARIVDFLLMSKVMIRHLDRRGIHTYLWVINNDTDFERAFSLGAKGVMTDYPTQLRHFLDQREAIDKK